MRTWLVGISLFLVSVCGGPPKAPVQGDWRFLVLSDTHVSNDTTKDARLVRLVNAVNRGDFGEIRFVVNTGDVVSSVYQRYDSLSATGDYDRLAKAVGLFRRLRVPFYLIMGNHDYKIDSDRDSDALFPLSEILTMEEIWRRRTGLEPYYSFGHAGWRFVALNSMRGRPHRRFFDEAQLDWLERQLNAGQPVVLFVHHPLRTDHFRLWCKPGSMITRNGEPRFFEMLWRHKERIKGIFVGHGHRWVSDVLFGSIPVYETASFGDENDFPCLLVAVDTLKCRLWVQRVERVGRSPTAAARKPQ